MIRDFVFLLFVVCLVWGLMEQLKIKIKLYNQEEK